MRVRRLSSFVFAIAPVLLAWPAAMNAVDVAAGGHARAKSGRSTTIRPVAEEAHQPGLDDFHRAIDAVQHKHFERAVDWYEASASWGYKPAQYNLAMMYFIGEGTAVDKPRALAWAALAAERGDEDYADARERIYSELTAEEFAQANAIWRGLRKTYGDAVAEERARHRLAQIEEATASPRIGAIAASAVDVRGNGDVQRTSSSETGGATAASASAARATSTTADMYPADASATAASEPIEVPLYGGGDAD
jgi:TPR repeat protein